MRQAEAQKTAADSAVTARLPEAYQWLLVPEQTTPQSAVEWQGIRLSGQESLAVRASKKLKSDELLVTSFAASRLRMELDRVPLWRESHVSIKQLAEDFAKYLYLPRLGDSSVLLGAIKDGLGLLTWEQDSFAYAESFDEDAKRYRGLRAGQRVDIVDAGSPGLLVKPEVARSQLEAESPPAPAPGQTSVIHDGGVAPPDSGQETVIEKLEAKLPRRFHGTVELDPTRLTRDVGQFADEVVQHLTRLVGSEVEVTMEISARIPDGVPDNVVRTVTENCRTLKFKSQGFEAE